jgi:hypothetical protein
MQKLANFVEPEANTLATDQYDKRVCMFNHPLFMARYTSLLTVAVPLQQLQEYLAETLKTCNLEVVYETGDYLMARESPGDVPFAKLVSVEVLIDRTTATDEKVRMKLVVKNEELPLQTRNHCQQMFELVHTAMASSRRWKLIEQLIETNNM